MRAFIAIPLSTAAAGELAQAVAQVRAVLPAEKFKWVRPANYHLTVKFLGELRDEQVPAVVDACEQVEMEWPPVLRVSGIALEPAGGSVRLVVGELAGDVDAVLRIFTQLDDALSRAGFRKEGRPFWPHVTIARAKMAARLSAAQRDAWAQAASRVKPGEEFPVDRLQLMESQLMRDGPIYTPMATIRVGGK